jgi:hypothetical protein
MICAHCGEMTHYRICSSCHKDASLIIELPKPSHEKGFVGLGLTVLGCVLAVTVLCFFVVGPYLITTPANTVVEVPIKMKATPPNGLKGLKFGMTIEEAEKALPEFAQRKPISPFRVAVPFERTNKEAYIPGLWYEFDTTFGDFAVRCFAGFVVKQKLSFLRCVIFGPNTKIAWNKAVADLEETFRKKYGEPKKERGGGWYNSQVVFEIHEDLVIWEDENALLELETGNWQDYEKSHNININSASKAHVLLLQEMRAQLVRDATQEKLRVEAEKTRQDADKKLGDDF